MGKTSQFAGSTGGSLARSSLHAEVEKVFRFRDTKNLTDRP
jgi:hypothetical protein